MEQQTRRARKKEATRRRILEAAFKLFVEQGFDNTTVDQITEEADIGKGTFYNYFTTKEAALYDFMEDLGSQRGQKLWAGILGLGDTRERLTRTFQSLASWFEEYPELVKVYTVDRVNTGLKNPGSFTPNHFEIYLAEVLQKGQEAGDIRGDIPHLQLANYLSGITLIQLCQWFQGGAGIGLYELVIQGVNFFLTGALNTEKE